MAGGGVGEAMLIGAAVGAGTGGVMSAAQDKDVGQGMLVGALGGAATGGIGAGIGGAAADAVGTTAVDQGIQTGIEKGAETAGENTISSLAQQGSDQAARSMSQIPALQNTPANIDATQVAQTTPSTGPPKPNIGQMGKGSGFFPGMNNAQVAGASTAGGISGLVAANGQPAPYQAPDTQPYNGPLSKFKLAGPQLSQYSYDPNSYQPSVAPGYADGGIATLQTGMFPQSQMDHTQFATPSQMPVSREIIDSDYDATINPYTGDLPRFADGGGINFIHNLQPGGEFGDMTADMYGAVQEHKPKWLQDIEPGGFIGATVPGKLDWEEKKRKEEEEKIAQDRAAKEAQAAKMYDQMAQQTKMAHGGIADLGSYSDGGRLLRGPGDGMSDNIPASIAGKQPARLADGEFVVPADVVSGLGNGSTDAGAKTLYKMMDKVRHARTGTKKQGREIDADKYMPKMAQGGIASFASGNLVVQDGQIGTYDEGGGFVPYSNGAANPFVAQAPSQSYTPSVYTPDARYNAYTIANRPSSNQPQFYGNIYRGETPDFSTPGYTLTGGNLGRWSNVAGESARAVQGPSINQQITQTYLKQLGRAPDQGGFNFWMGHANAPTYENNFNAQSYLAANPDVARDAYFGSRPYEHYIKYGVNENRLGGGSNLPAVLNDITRSREAEALRSTKASADAKSTTNKRRGGIASLV